eukprot:351841-Chlamydomonas_euryale.AAC.2
MDLCGGRMLRAVFRFGGFSCECLSSPRQGPLHATCPGCTASISPARASSSPPSISHTHTHHADSFQAHLPLLQPPPPHTYMPTGRVRPHVSTLFHTCPCCAPFRISSAQYG